MKSVPLLVVYFNIFSVLLSPSWGSPDTCNDVTDPATGLTGKQIRLVTYTWGLVRKDPKASGIAIMTHFLGHNRDYQKLFSGFGQLPFEELAKNPKFQEHSIAVINTLSSVIDSIENPGVLVGALTGLGMRHKGRGITKGHYQNLAKTVTAVLERALGPKWTSAVSTAWLQTVGKVYEVIFKVYE